MIFSSLLLSYFSLSSAKSEGSPGYWAVPVTKQKQTRNSQPLLESIQNDFSIYLATFALGTPGQEVSVLLDTGSSDLWVFNQGEGVSFDPSKSSTASLINNDFSESYADGRRVKGSYYKDEINWGPISVSAQFAVANAKPGKGPSAYGIFGIGKKQRESDEGLAKPYDNFPYVLKNQGLIESVSYSLYLDSVNSKTGTILFGALDTSRYTGELSVVPMVSNDHDFSVELSVAGYTFTGILDSGTTYTFLPNDVVDTIAKRLGASYDGKYWRIKNPPEDSVFYTIGNTEIEVPKQELWNQRIRTDGYWYLTIMHNTIYGKTLLGDTFLRSAYVVYDLENSTIGIANANWNPGPSNYVVIGSQGIVA